VSLRPVSESWRSDLALRAEPGRYVRPLGLGLAAEVVSGAVLSVVVGIVGFLLLAGYREGEVPAARTLVVAVAGVLVVALAVVVGGLVTATLLRRAGLPGSHARAVGAAWASGAAGGLLVVSGAVSGGSFGQWLGGLVGIGLGAVLVLLVELARS
jgi:hypothetical protein